MHNQVLHNQLGIIQFVRTTCAVGEPDDECRAHWVNYLCVMLSAFLENSFHEIYQDYYAKRGVTSGNIRRIPNPTSEHFVRRIKRFNHLWKNDFLNFIADSGRDVAIDSIMRLRHQIAHRGESNISTAQLAEYLPKCVEVIEFIEDRLVA